MPLTPGSRLGPYEIVSAIGAGGMGEMYRARDTRLERDVAMEMLAEGALPMRRFLQVAAQVSDGLAKAHASRVVHRDLKPENVMVTKNGFAKILDFGLAKLTQPEEEWSGAAPRKHRRCRRGRSRVW